MAPIKDPLHDLRREQGQAQHPAHIGAVNPLGRGELLAARVGAVSSSLRQRKARARALTSGYSDERSGMNNVGRKLPVRFAQSECRSGHSFSSTAVSGVESEPEPVRALGSGSVAALERGGFHDVAGEVGPSSRTVADQMASLYGWLKPRTTMACVKEPSPGFWCDKAFLDLERCRSSRRRTLMIAPRPARLPATARRASSCWSTPTMMRREQCQLSRRKRS